MKNKDQSAFSLCNQQQYEMRQLTNRLHEHLPPFRARCILLPELSCPRPVHRKSELPSLDRPIKVLRPFRCLPVNLAAARNLLKKKGCKLSDCTNLLHRSLDVAVGEVGILFGHLAKGLVDFIQQRCCDSHRVN